jgi:hypothetical protein
MPTIIRAPRAWSFLLTGVAVSLVAGILALPGDARDDDDHDETSRIRRGFEISPVDLNLRGRNRALVGLGSYLVNAQFACSECHTWPQFAPGGNPFLGEPEVINSDGYLAGGRAFGPIISNNITPDADGFPAGMTFAEFDLVMRSGIDRDHSFPPVPSPANDLMQVMPWPVFRNITHRDMRALYEYLSAIPSVP